MGHPVGETSDKEKPGDLVETGEAKVTLAISDKISVRAHRLSAPVLNSWPSGKQRNR